MAAKIPPTFRIPVLPPGAHYLKPGNDESTRHLPSSSLTRTKPNMPIIMPSQLDATKVNFKADVVKSKRGSKS